MSLVFCRACGKEIHESAPACPTCGAPNATSAVVIPEGVKGWSWGAFLWNWIWAIGNRTWIGVWSLVPFFGFFMAIVLGFKGREWAWKNKHWDSLEHFNRVQRRWSLWGIILTLVSSIIFIAIIMASPD